MKKHERVLRWLLRVVGGAALFAAPCAMMPYSWMNTIHQVLGMGDLPDKPVVGYLARSTSAFYALLGGLLWVLSSDLRRYRPVLCYLGGAIILFGLMLLCVDFLGGMPLWWSLAEGPFNIGFGTAVLVLSLRIGPHTQRASSPNPGGSPI